MQHGEVISYEGNKFVIDTKESLVGKRTEIREYRDSTMYIFIENQKRNFSMLEEEKRAA